MENRTSKKTFIPFLLQTLLVIGLSVASTAAVAQTPEPETAPAEGAETEKPPVEWSDDKAKTDAATTEPVYEKPAPTPMPATTAAGASNPEAMALFQQAFEDLAKKDRKAAKAKLQRIITDFPSDPLAQNSGYILTLLVPATNGPAEYEKTTGLARAEFVTFQTIHGIALAAEFCVLIECGGQGAVAMLMLGGGAGLGVSLLATTDGITDGHAQVLNSGVLWGAWHAGALAGMEVTTGDGIIISAMGLQLAGIGVGELIHRTIEPTAGDVSLATSGGVWSAFMTGMVMGMAEIDNSKAAFGGLLAASDIGLVGGAFLAQRYPMSRGRVLVIDSGGILGALVGVGFPVLIDADEFNAQFFFGSALLGTATGLGLATYFTRDWDVDENPGTALNLNLGIAPTNGGGLATAHGTF